jgi:hypothetical protein
MARPSVITRNLARPECTRACRPPNQLRQSRWWHPPVVKGKKHLPRFGQAALPGYRDGRKAHSHAWSSSNAGNWPPASQPTSLSQMFPSTGCSTSGFTLPLRRSVHHLERLERVGLERILGRVFRSGGGQIDIFAVTVAVRAPGHRDHGRWRSCGNCAGTIGRVIAYGRRFRSNTRHQ